MLRMLFWIIGSLESRSSADMGICSIDYGWRDSRLCRGEVVGYVPSISWHGRRMQGSGTIRSRGLVTSVTRRPAIDRGILEPWERFSAALCSQHSECHAQRGCESCVFLLQLRSTDAVARRRRRMLEADARVRRDLVTSVTRQPALNSRLHDAR